MRAKGMGAKVIVMRSGPIAALEAAMDGYQVMPMLNAAKIGDIFITVPGISTSSIRHILHAMKDGAILANSGHFNVEINIPALESMAASKRRIRPFVDEYVLADRQAYISSG